MSVYYQQNIFVGDRVVKLTDDQLVRLRNYLIYMAMHDPILPNRFYSYVNEDTPVADLLSIHKDRKGRPISDLPRIYSDVMNKSKFIVSGYKSLIMRDVALDNISVYNEDDDIDEVMTKEVRRIFSKVDRGGFYSFLSHVVEAGLLYGDMFVVMIRDPSMPGKKPQIWAYLKEAPAVFPIIYDNEVVKYVVNYHEYESGKNSPVEWSELYDNYSVTVWKDREIREEVSGVTGIDEPTLIMSQLVSSRSEIYGNSILSGLIEAMVTACGFVGSSIRAIRLDQNAITIFSGQDAVEAVSLALGRDPEVKESKQNATFDPDQASVICGGDVVGTKLVSTSGANIVPVSELLDNALRERCALYALHKLGANASGKAIELTLDLLKAEIQDIRHGVEELLTHMARVALKLANPYKLNTIWPEGYKVKHQWKELFPETPTEKQNRLIPLLSANIVPIEYVAEELGLLKSEVVRKHLESVKKQKEVEAERPKNDLFGELLK